MSLTSSIFYLKIAAGILIAFGVLFFCVLFPPFYPIANFLVDLVFLPLDGKQAFTTPESNILIAILCGISVGWGVMIYMVTQSVYAADPKLGGRIILTAIITWFVIDSTASIWVGAWFNAILNLGFFATFAAPILLYKNDTTT